MTTWLIISRVICFFLGLYDVFECSNCKMEHYEEDDTLTSFCPYCGAEMGGEDGKKI